MTHQRHPLFSVTSTISLWHHAVAKVQRTRPFGVDAEVILPDHLHVIWTLPSGDSDYSTRIRLVKSEFTKAYGVQRPSDTPSSRGRKGERCIWQRRYWEHTIDDERDYQSHVDYIHYNPVRHGLVTAAGDWRHSTFHEWIARGHYDPTWGTNEPESVRGKIWRE